MAKTWTYTTYYSGSNRTLTGYFQSESETSTILANDSTFTATTPKIRGAATKTEPGWSWGDPRLLRLWIKPSWTGSGVWRIIPTTQAVSSGEYCEWVDYTYNANFNTSDYFNSSNPTVGSVYFGAWEGAQIDIMNADGTSVDSNVKVFDGTNRFIIAPITLKLDVPPTATVSAISYDKPFYYAGLTTATVTVSDVAAYYGGSVTDVTLRIGSQTDTKSGNGTFSILLDTAGTFTPTLTVTDSRGQTFVTTYAPINVLTYTAPTVNFTADRTTSTGTPDEEGTYATCPATFVFADAIANLIAPSVVLTDENGTQTTPTVNWYTTRAADGTLSGTVNWASVSAGDTVYGLVPGLNTNYSYQISIRPRDSQGTGTAIIQTVASAFYTIDFLAGGHGIAFGQPSSNPGFECNMPTIFHDTVDVEDTLTAQDMTQQEIDDFVNSLTVSGTTWESGAYYLKLPDGTLICWGVTALAASATYARCYFSVNFVNTDYAAIGVIQGTPITTTGIGGKATDHVDINATSSSYARNISWIAIGRWK